MQSATQKLRVKYRPPKVSVLFIGEAPPASGTFFYSGNSQVYRYLKDVLAPHLGESADFLSTFAARGYFLDDLVLEPVDHIPVARRDPIFRENVPMLANRMAEYRPQMIVTILKRIAPYVEEARFHAGLDVPHHAVPFPGTGQQGNFRRTMVELIKHFPQNPAAGSKK
jgi:hypothetical protein